MIRFVTKWVGLDTLAAEEFEALRAPTESAIMKATLYYEGKVKQKLIGPRTGRIYGDHQASAPGEAPAAHHGDLRKSITHSDVVWEGDEASAEVGTNHPAGRILEWGGIIRRISSTGKSYVIRILPRPYFAATWLEEEAKIQAILDKAVTKRAPVLADVAAEVVE